MKKENEKTPPQINPVQYSYPEMYRQEDEIDLYELWSALWKGRWKIVFISLSTSLIALGYLLSVNPIYQAQTFFLPPLAEDIRGLRLTENPTKKEVPIEAETYQIFQRNLQSRSLRLEFFRAHKLLTGFQTLSHLDNIEEPYVFETFFDQKLKVSFPKKGNSSLVSLTFELSDNKLSAAWLNSFVDFIIIKTRQQLSKTANLELSTNKDLLWSQINSLRKTAMNQRLDRITRLQESLMIAKLSGLIDPIKERGNIDMEYMRGARAIESEIKVLQNRKNEDPFIGNLRTLQTKINYLAAISIEEKNIKPVTIDQLARIPSHPIKPKKQLIVVIALLLGIMLGIIFVLINTALTNKKSKE